MRDFVDREVSVENKNRYKILHGDGSEEFVYIERADNPIKEGTFLNRGTMMEMQGLYEFDVTFGGDGTISMYNRNTGDIEKIEQSPDAIAISTFIGAESGKTIRYKYTAEANGVIKGRLM